MSIVVGDELVEETVEPEENAFQMPDKFTGKSAEEVAQSYVELEKMGQKQRDEVGELRKLTDRYLHQELSRNTTIEPEKESDSPIEFDDLMENPKKVIDTAVEQKLGAVNKRLDEQVASQRLEKFMSDNPDYQEVSNTQEFYSWVNGSPYRARQLASAQSGDLDAASDMLEGFREQSKLTATTESKDARSAKRTSDLQAATSETASTGNVPGKIFKRKDLMKLYQENPDEYYGMSDEIEKAYREGRVK